MWAFETMKIRPREIEVNLLFFLSIDSISVAFFPERRKSWHTKFIHYICFRGVIYTLSCLQSAFKLLSALSFFRMCFGCFETIDLWNPCAFEWRIFERCSFGETIISIATWGRLKRTGKLFACFSKSPSFQALIFPGEFKWKQLNFD